MPMTKRGTKKAMEPGARVDAGGGLVVEGGGLH